MGQEIEINNLQELSDWIENNNFHIFDKEEDNFTIEAPNNATWQIQFDKDDWQFMEDYVKSLNYSGNI